MLLQCRVQQNLTSSSNHQQCKHTQNTHSVCVCVCVCVCAKQNNCIMYIQYLYILTHCTHTHTYSHTHTHSHTHTPHAYHLNKSLSSSGANTIDVHKLLHDAFFLLVNMLQSIQATTLNNLPNLVSQSLPNKGQAFGFLQEQNSDCGDCAHCVTVVG